MQNLWKFGSKNRWRNHANHAATHTLAATHDVRPERTDVIIVPDTQDQWQKEIYARLNKQLLELKSQQVDTNPDGICGIVK